MGSASWIEGARARVQRGHLTSGSHRIRQVCWGRSHQEERKSDRDVGGMGSGGEVGDKFGGSLQRRE